MRTRTYIISGLGIVVLGAGAAILFSSDSSDVIGDHEITSTPADLVRSAISADSPPVSTPNDSRVDRRLGAGGASVPEEDLVAVDEALLSQMIRDIERGRPIPLDSKTKQMLRGFLAEPIDPIWSVATENQILDAISAVPGISAVNIDVECRTNTCRIYVAHPPSESDSADRTGKTIIEVVQASDLDLLWLSAMPDEYGNVVSRAFVSGSEVVLAESAPNDASDVGPMPLLRIMPSFPESAVQEGVDSGYVVLEFTTTPEGSVRDISVVESSSSAFESAAINAAASWRYEPSLVDGNPVAVPGVRARVDFSAP